MDSIQKFFPLPVPRPKQVKALEFIELAWNRGFTDVVIEAPTGAGKSAVSIAACRWGKQLDRPNAQGGGYVLVQQKALQDQMEAEVSRYSSPEFPTRIIKGAVEYECPNFNRCSLGLRRKCACKKEGSCAYRVAKDAFLASTAGIANYAYFAAEREHVGQVGPRQVLCADECHGLSSWISHNVGLQINASSFPDYAPTLSAQDLLDGPRTVREFAAWAKDVYVPAAIEQAAVLASANNNRAVEKAFEVEDHARRAQSFADRILENRGEGWVFWREGQDDLERLVACARPLEPGPYFGEMFSTFPFRIHLSAFPGAKATYCKELGLDPSKVAWLKLGSTFPVENRAVILAGAGSLGRGNLEASLPAALRMVVKILDSKPERGLIHTHSYDLAREVCQALAKTAHAARVTTHKTAEDRKEALERHAATPGSVLVSPSMGEGYDFKGELAMFAIILKCPFLYLGDKWVEAKKMRDPTWYGMEAVKAILQAAGRGVRSETCTCVTYVLDSDARRLIEQYREFIPKWFMEAIKFL